jgi:hypothetical protein
LILRDRIKRIKRIPFFLKPAVGAAMNWLIGISVFFAIGKIGVFGLGYGDLEKIADSGWDECLFRSGRASADYFDSYCVRRLVGLIDRSEILTNQLPKVAVVPAQAMPAHSTIREAVAKMVENSLRLRVSCVHDRKYADWDRHSSRCPSNCKTSYRMTPWISR